MGVCCVDGCDIIKEGVVYFEFPTSRSIRRKWLDVLNMGSKVPLGTVVCSQHFSCDEYEVVRGKVRLKSKVVPTLLLKNKSQDVTPTETITEPVKEKSPEEGVVDKLILPENKILDTSVLPEEKMAENSLSQEKVIDNSLSDKIIQANSVLSKEKAVDKLTPDEKMVEISILPKEKMLQNLKEDSTVGNTVAPRLNTLSKSQMEPKGVLLEIHKVVINEINSLSDPKQPPPDFEDMITNYQIKNSKPNSLLPQEIEIEVPPAYERDDTIVVDDHGDTAPVFIEIPVDKDNNTHGSGAQDCLMVLESVQVELDPSSLMLPEREYEESEKEDNLEEEKPPDKKPDPISLLTSSDEDDVILQEPHIDTVEVSDETDEEDMPLDTLAKKAKQKKKLIEKSVKKKQPETVVKSSEVLPSLFWKNKGYDYYCMQCNYTTTNSIEYNSHLKDHQRILQVCSACSYTTSSQSQFARHLKKHKEDKRYKNQQRDYRSKRSKFSLLCHITSNGNGNEYIQSVKNGSKCKKCGYFSKNESVMNNHVVKCNARTSKTACDQCSYVATRKSDLKRHWERKHKDSVVELYSDSSCD